MLVRFQRKKQVISGFVAKGHTGYADHGEDIVCAAVSALTQTTVIGLQEVAGIDVDLVVKEGYLECMLPSGFCPKLDDDSQVILNTLYKGLIAIYEEYGDFLRIEEVESCE